ncbi:tail assembly protein [Yersinia enterocolitica]|uniref:tail assembly protein n=1 Tax=Yersinia enterocolitica TaxID=630 RepID=UPI002859A23B|nr:tail assembly protein [Yersinia enterocolitica]EKN4073049.1 tail assembly protein [Yersinia enterocolitica]EKN4145802.1 tail assembly protein [Yersinia enterocolitica]EKN5942962.1 tail assembly protein [Yersinia enterocolitica]EKN6098047.1 tail assembly protein [Yersinia enterocolitica]
MTVFAQEIMTPIKLSGSLATRFGRNHQRVISHKKEAFKALSVTIPGFEEYLITAKKRGLTFAIFVGGKNVGREELELASGGQEIRIVPVIIGSKKAGIFQTILGAVLVVVGAIGAFTPFGQAFGGGVWGTYAMQMGAAMMVGGVVQMLSPQVGGLASRQSPDNKPSYAFGGPVNSTAQGNPVGVLYGKRRIGGAVISAGIYAEDQM